MRDRSYFVVEPGGGSVGGGSTDKSRLCATVISHFPDALFVMTKVRRPLRSGRGLPCASVAPVKFQRTSTDATSGRMKRILTSVKVITLVLKMVANGKV